MMKGNSLVIFEIRLYFGVLQHPLTQSAERQYKRRACLFRVLQLVIILEDWAQA